MAARQQKAAALLLLFTIAGLCILAIWSFEPYLHSFVLSEQDPSASTSTSSTTSKANTERADEEEKLGTTPSKGPLNILLLYADDWSYLTLGAMGNSFVKTPYIDQLAKDGMLFEHNCVTTSICMVSRATLYTGQYASRHRTLKSWDEVYMYEDGVWDKTLYPSLYRAGYHVGFFGKWHHLDPPPPKTFHERTFTPFEHIVTRDGVTKHITQWNEDDGMDFLLKRPKDKPFALTISFFATHAEDHSQEQYIPMNTSLWLYANETVPNPVTHTQQHWLDMPPFFTEANFGRGRYKKRYATEDLYQHHMKNTYRMVTEVDAACGRLIEEVERQGVLNNTIVIFTTDNGNFHGQHGLAEKWYSYEEALRVPLVIRDPRMAKDKIGTSNSDFTLNIDLAPTILSAANIPVPSVMQGRDMAELYLPPQSIQSSDSDSNSATPAPWRTEFMYEWWGDRELLPSNFALVRKDKKYIYWSDHEYEQLFDMIKDPLEEFDIKHLAEHKETIQEMKTRMRELQALAKAGTPM